MVKVQIFLAITLATLLAGTATGFATVRPYYTRHHGQNGEAAIERFSIDYDLPPPSDFPARTESPVAVGVTDQAPKSFTPVKPKDSASSYLPMTSEDLDAKPSGNAKDVKLQNSSPQQGEGKELSRYKDRLPVTEVEAESQSFESKQNIPTTITNHGRIGVIDQPKVSPYVSDKNQDSEDVDILQLFEVFSRAEPQQREHISNYPVWPDERLVSIAQPSIFGPEDFLTIFHSTQSEIKQMLLRLISSQASIRKSVQRIEQKLFKQEQSAKRVRREDTRRPATRQTGMDFSEEY